MTRCYPSTLLLLLVASTALAQGKNMKDALGTRLTATSETIVLDWDPKHPWNVDLMRGATLVAEYNTRSQGVVLQKLSTGKLNAGGLPGMRFLLPVELTATPTGPVCLFVQLGNSHVLPVRNPRADHGDTSRFRDERWERGVVEQTASAQHKRDLEQLRTAANDAVRRLEQAKLKLGKQGWTETGGCEGIALPSFAVSRPPDVLPASEQPAGARRACISRVVLAEREVQYRQKEPASTQNEDKIEDYTELISGVVLAPGRAASLLGMLGTSPNDQNAQERQRQLKAFRKDWELYASQPHSPGTALLGNERDPISLQSGTRETGLKLARLLIFLSLGRPAPPGGKDGFQPEDLAGFAGGELEAYSRCVVDSEKQLRTKLDQWNSNQSNAPQLAEIARRQLVAVCTRDASSLTLLHAEKQEMDGRLREAEEKALANAGTSSRSQADPFLNGTTCSVR